MKPQLCILKVFFLRTMFARKCYIVILNGHQTIPIPELCKGGNFATFFLFFLCIQPLFCTSLAMYKQLRKRNESRIKWNNHLSLLLVYMCICICIHVNMCVHANVGLQVFLDLRVHVHVCVAALSQPSAPPAGKGPGLRHQLQAGMRMAESQTDSAVGYYV